MPYDKVTPGLILASTRKLLDIQNDAAEPDDRDSLSNQTVHGPEDFFSERIAKDSGGTLKNVLWKSTTRGKLSGIYSGLHTSQLDHVLLSSGIGQCFDDKTYVLTRRGFVFWSDVTLDDEFACRINEKVEYRRANKLFAYQYNGKMYGLRSKTLNYLVTPNHRCYVSARSHGVWKGYAPERADSIHGKQRRFLGSLGLLDSSSCSSVFSFYARNDRWGDLLTVSIPAEPWFEFLGWWLAEGSAFIYRDKRGSRSEYTVTISQTSAKHGEERKDIAALLDRMGISWRYSEGSGSFIIKNKALCLELLKYGNSRTKRIPRYVFDASVVQLQALFHAYMRGDGNEYGRYIKSSTASAGLAMDLVELFGRLNRKASIAIRDKGNSKWALEHVVSFTQNINYCPEPQAYYITDYSGLVYCAEVPGGMLYVMREGSPHWSCNSLEETNPLDAVDQSFRLSRLGEGAIPDESAIPMEARAVQPSYFGFIDPHRAPESARVGVELRTTFDTYKGKDNQLYSKFTNSKTGKTEYLSSQQAGEKILAFPGELESGKQKIRAMVRGKMDYVDREEVEYELPHATGMFNSNVNLVPMLNAVQGNRHLTAGKMFNQALALQTPEAPLVRAETQVPGVSFDELMSRKVGAVFSDKPGTVIQASPDKIIVKHSDGTTKEHELYQNFPFNRRSFVNSTPMVKAGDRIEANQLLAKSNYTDDKGTLAVGTNLRVAFIPYRGLTYEDAVVISSSAAQKMKSEHMYTPELEFDDNIEHGYDKYISRFPTKYAKNQLTALDAEGAIKPGMIVKKGDPLILALGKPNAQGEGQWSQIARKAQSSVRDRTVEWEHDFEGEITDVVKGKNGIQVAVKAYVPMEAGDKLCFDTDTSILTKTGWKTVTDVTLSDEVATLNPDTDELEYQHPTHVWMFDHDDVMYHLVTKHVDMLVTLDHRLWVKHRKEKKYRTITAKELYKSKDRWQFKKDCKWVGRDIETITFEIDCWNRKDNVISSASMDSWLEFLGYYIAEGWCYEHQNGSKQVLISQFKSSKAWPKIRDVISRLGYRYTYLEKENRFLINSRQLYRMLVGLGDSLTKYVPSFVGDLSARQIGIFVSAYLDGDGHRGNTWEFGSSSKRLAEDIQILCFKLGWCVSLRKLEVDQMSNWAKHPFWRGRINKKHLHPVWQKCRLSTYSGLKEEIVRYTGKIYCITVPNHIIYVKRGEKSYWSLNSGRYG